MEFADVGSYEKAKRLEEREVAICVYHAGMWKESFDKELTLDEQFNTDYGRLYGQFLDAVEGKTLDMDFILCPFYEFPKFYRDIDPDQLEQFRKRVFTNEKPVNIKIEDVQINLNVDGVESGSITVSVEEEKPKKKRKAKE